MTITRRTFSALLASAVAAPRAALSQKLDNCAFYSGVGGQLTHYEVDFAAQIVRQCRALGVKEIHDPAVCTACDLDRYYSYRAEKGKTGRMVALIGLNPTIAN